MIVSIDDAEFEMFESITAGCDGCFFQAPDDDRECAATLSGARVHPCKTNHEQAGFNYSTTMFRPHNDAARVWHVARNLTK